MAEKIQMLFREQGITIACILKAIEMAICILVEELLSGGGGTGSASAVGGKLLPKEKKMNGLGTNLKPWLGYQGD